MNRIYFIREGDSNRFKVGFSSDPEGRALEFQTGNSNKLSVYLSIPTHNASKVEAKLHGVLSRYHIRGEWFEIDEESIPELISYAMRWQYDGGIYDEQSEHCKSGKTVSEKVIMVLRKKGPLTAREIYTGVRGLNTERALQVLSELESEGVIEAQSIGRKTMWGLA